MYVLFKYSSIVAVLYSCRSSSYAFMWSLPDVYLFSPRAKRVRHGQISWHFVRRNL